MPLAVAIKRLGGAQWGISYSSAAVTKKRHNHGNLESERFIWAYDSREVRAHYGREA